MWKKSWQQLRERVDLIVLLAVLLVVATAWFFDELANSVTAGDTQRFDDWVVASLRNPDNTALPRGPRWLLEAGRDITALGSPTIVVLMITAVAGYLALKRQFNSLIFAIVAASSGGLFTTLLKRHFERPRPAFGDRTGLPSR